MRRVLLWTFLALIHPTAGCTSRFTVALTAPEPLTYHKADSAYFAVIGDYGQAGPDEKRVADLVHSWHPDFVITVGDNNYPNGSAQTIDDNIGQYYVAWIQFGPYYRGRYKTLSAPLNRFFPTLGNHDWRSPFALPYLEYFNLPSNKRYYHYQWGPVAFFAVDSDPHEPDGIDALSKQAQWLKQALAASQAPWKIVYMHHAPYSSGWHGSSEMLQWPYPQWGASAVLAGHDHHYERVMINRFPYFVCGLGGAAISTVGEHIPIEGSQEDKVYDAKHGAMQVMATSSSLKFAFFSKDNELMDTYTLETNTSSSTSSSHHFLTP